MIFQCQSPYKSNSPRKVLNNLWFRQFLYPLSQPLIYDGLCMLILKYLSTTDREIVQLMPHISVIFRICDTLAYLSIMNFILLGVFLTLVFTISDAQQTCTNGGVESANPLGTCGGCEDQVRLYICLNHINFTII